MHTLSLFLFSIYICICMSLCRLSNVNYLFVYILFFYLFFVLKLLEKLGKFLQISKRKKKNKKKTLRCVLLKTENDRNIGSKLLKCTCGGI